MKHKMENKDTFIEIQGICSFQTHERHTIIVFEDYNNDTHTIEIPSNEFLEWFDKKTIHNVYETYTKHLKSNIL
tara:strand:+ start:798 stop:1019 length:222 start_codon:yes stop_codon:yes gene_type:complete